MELRPKEGKGGVEASTKVTEVDEQGEGFPAVSVAVGVEGGPA